MIIYIHVSNPLYAGIHNKGVSSRHEGDMWENAARRFAEHLKLGGGFVIGARALDWHDVEWLRPAFPDLARMVCTERGLFRFGDPLVGPVSYASVIRVHYYGRPSATPWTFEALQALWPVRGEFELM